MSAMAVIFARLAGEVRAGARTLDQAAESLVLADLGARIDTMDAHRLAETVTRAKRALALAAEHEAGAEFWNPYGADGADLAAVQSAAEVDMVLDSIRAAQHREEAARLARFGFPVPPTPSVESDGSARNHGE